MEAATASRTSDRGCSTGALARCVVQAMPRDDELALETAKAVHRMAGALGVEEGRALITLLHDNGMKERDIRPWKVLFDHWHELKR